MLSLVLACFVLPALSLPVSMQPRALSFGSCSNPTIIFANGLDGRNEPAFEPANEADFNHGSALNIGVISSFICQRLQSPCNAGSAAITACAAGEAAATQVTGGGAADAFNAALGFITNFANVVGTGPAAASTSTTSAEVSTSTDATCPPPSTVTVTVTATVTATGATTTSVAAVAASTSAISTAATSGDLNAFTGLLGSAPVPITAGGKGFIVEGNQFINLSAAVDRACSIQNNACADAANAGGNKAFTVADCNTQEQQCNAQA